jgi:cytidine deaminase
MEYLARLAGIGQTFTMPKTTVDHLVASEPPVHATEPSQEVLDQLARMAELAWQVRENARLLAGGKTKVGCVVLAEDGRLFHGANIQHQFRSHDIHAEIAAIAAMVSSGAKKAVAVLIAAERELFTPCGACMDWIMEFGGAACILAVQSGHGHPMRLYSAGQLMPYYPR